VCIYYWYRLLYDILGMLVGGFCRYTILLSIVSVRVIKKKKSRHLSEFRVIPPGKPYLLIFTSILYFDHVI